MIEIPAEYIEAWRIFMEFNVRDSGLSDALVWAIAALRRSEFEREHMVNLGDQATITCEVCGSGQVGDTPFLDSRHTWDDAQWQQAVRAELEAKP